MVRRVNILGFLGLGTDWNPSLLFVLGCGVMVNLVTFSYMIHYKYSVSYIEKYHISEMLCSTPKTAKLIGNYSWEPLVSASDGASEVYVPVLLSCSWQSLLCLCISFGWAVFSSECLLPENWSIIWLEKLVRIVWMDRKFKMLLGMIRQIKRRFSWQAMNIL